MEIQQILLGALGVCVTIIGFGIRALFKMETEMSRLATNQENAMKDHVDIKDFMKQISSQQTEHESRISVLESMRRGFGGNSNAYQGGH